MVARFEELAKYKLANPMSSPWKSNNSQSQQQDEFVEDKSANLQMDVAKTLASWHTLSSGIKDGASMEDDEGVHEEESHSDTASTPHTSSSTGASSDSHSNPGSHVSDHSEHELANLTTVSQHTIRENQMLLNERTIHPETIHPTTSINGNSHVNTTLAITQVIENSLTSVDAMRTFTYLPPIKVETKEFNSIKSESGEEANSDVLNSSAPSMKHISVKTDHPIICTGARFSSFVEFETAFELWKNMYHHPFRVASSETLRQPDGSTYEVFRYRYIVYHCAHYGAPRMRGVGKRPNQNYLPCGCKAMLRLNFNYSENALRITTLNDVHTGHEVTAENYARISAKVRKISPNSIDSEEHSPRSSRGSNSSVKSHSSPAQSSQKPSPSEHSFYSPKISSPAHNPHSSDQNLPRETQLYTNANMTTTTVASIYPITASPLTSGVNLLSSNAGAFAPPSTQASIVSLLASISQQQQRERAAAASAFLAAHKENLLLAARNSAASMANSSLQNTNPLVPLLQGLLNPTGMNPVSILTNSGSVMPPANQPLANESTSLLSQLATSSQLSSLLNQPYGSRAMSISDYLHSQRNVSKQQINSTTSQNSSTLTNSEHHPVDLSQNGTSLHLSVKPAPTQAQLMDAEKILSTVGEHLSRCNSMEMDERLRQLLTLLHSWGVFSPNPNSNNR